MINKKNINKMNMNMNILAVLAFVILTIDCQIDQNEYNVDLEQYNKIILKN